MTYEPIDRTGQTWEIYTDTEGPISAILVVGPPSYPVRDQDLELGGWDHPVVIVYRRGVSDVTPGSLGSYYEDRGSFAWDRYNSAIAYPHVLRLRRWPDALL